MNEMNIMLCCGAGMSSGFLAQRARQAAKKRKLSVSVDARAESEVAQYLKSIQVLMVGPHYANRLESFQKMAQPYGVPVLIIPQDIYATLNGDAILDLAMEQVK